MSKSIYHTPYTYLIKFKPTGQVYYGVRYAKGCSPDDLWNTYFTSSKVVKSLIEEYGSDTFDFQIRKTFDTVDAAREWETQVLQRMKVVNDDRWLNKTDRKSVKVIHTPESKNKISNTLKGRKLSPEHIKNMTVAVKGKTLSEEHKQKISLARKGKYTGKENPMSGKTHTNETRRKISTAHKNKILSEEQKSKISKKLKDRTQKKITCSHCNKEGGISLMKRYHFDNCKFRIFE